jgi:hypothetical protein
MLEVFPVFTSSIEYCMYIFTMSVSSEQLNVEWRFQFNYIHVLCVSTFVHIKWHYTFSILRNFRFHIRTRMVTIDLELKLISERKLKNLLCSFLHACFYGRFSHTSQFFFPFYGTNLINVFYFREGTCTIKKAS